MTHRKGKWMQSQYDELKRNRKTLQECYDRPSQAKREAYDDCIRSAIYTPNCIEWGITTYSTHKFTFAWLTNAKLYVMTADNLYYCYLFELIRRV